VTPPDPAKKLQNLLRKLRSGVAEPPRDAALDGCCESSDKLLWQLVYSFLAWESSIARASIAAKRLHGSVVDYNEMRVCLAEELASILGDRYPRGVERAARLKSTLNDLYKREHTVTLAPIAAMSKRDARTYLESLEGMPPYVAARLLLLAFGGHAFPVDSRIHAALLEEQCLPADCQASDASGWLERQFRAGEAAEPYLLVEAWLNDRPLPRAPTKRTAKADQSAEDRARASASRTPRRVGAPDKSKSTKPRKA
jgi:hypothetical protein